MTFDVNSRQMLRLTETKLLPNTPRGLNSSTSFVIDLTEYKKTKRSQLLVRPRICTLLETAEEFQRQLDTGVVNRRSQFAEYHGLTRARVPAGGDEGVIEEPDALARREQHRRRPISTQPAPGERKHGGRAYICCAAEAAGHRNEKRNASHAPRMSGRAAAFKDRKSIQRRSPRMVNRNEIAPQAGQMANRWGASHPATRLLEPQAVRLGAGEAAAGPEARATCQPHRQGQDVPGRLRRRVWWLLRQGRHPIRGHAHRGLRHLLSRLIRRTSIGPIAARLEDQARNCQRWAENHGYGKCPRCNRVVCPKCMCPSNGQSPAICKDCEQGLL